MLLRYWAAIALIALLNLACWWCFTTRNDTPPTLRGEPVGVVPTRIPPHLIG